VKTRQKQHLNRSNLKKFTPSFNFSDEYSHYLYSLRDIYPEIIAAQIGFFSIGRDNFITSGLIEFTSDIKLVFRESIDFSVHKIIKYVYEICRDNQLICFYDPQPHPNDLILASTFPHHKHVLPNIKRNRQPATGITFDKPNLPFLIMEIINQYL